MIDELIGISLDDAKELLLKNKKVLGEVKIINDRECDFSVMQVVVKAVEDDGKVILYVGNFRM